MKTRKQLPSTHNHTLSGLFIVILLLFGADLQANTKPIAPEHIEGAKNLDAEQVVNLILSNPKLLVIDARKNPEYTRGHIEGAINMLNTKMTRDWLEGMAPDKGTPLLFYCNGLRCMRSSDAVSKALTWGYKEVYWFRGGWKEWSEKRFPSVTQ